MKHHAFATAGEGFQAGALAAMLCSGIEIKIVSKALHGDAWPKYAQQLALLTAHAVVTVDTRGMRLATNFPVFSGAF